MENYPGCLFYLEFSIALMHKTLTNQNTAFLCERNYGKFSRLRAGRIIYITFPLRPARRLRSQYPKVFGSGHPNRKPIWYLFYEITTLQLFQSMFGMDSLIKT